jgi:predicted membrane protein
MCVVSPIFFFYVPLSLYRSFILSSFLFRLSFHFLFHSVVLISFAFSIWRLIDVAFETIQYYELERERDGREGELKDTEKKELSFCLLLLIAVT